MSDTPNVDDFLAYSELMALSDDIDGLTLEKTAFLDEQFNQTGNLPTREAVLIMKAALAIDEVLGMSDASAAFELLADLRVPKSVLRVWLAAQGDLHRRMGFRRGRPSKKTKS